MSQHWHLPDHPALPPVDPNDLNALAGRIATLRIQIVVATAQLDQAEAALVHLREQRGQG